MYVFCACSGLLCHATIGFSQPEVALDYIRKGSHQLIAQGEDSARFYFEHSLKEAQNHDDSLQLYHQIAAAWYNKSAQMDEAILWWNRYRKSPHEGHELVKSVYYSLGDAYKRSGQYPEAQIVFHELVDMLKGTDDKVYLALSWYHLGVSYTREGDYEYADNYLKNSLKLAREIPHPALERFCLVELGNAAYWRNEAQAAVEYHLEALARGGPDRAIYKNLGDAYLALGRMDSAHWYFQKALPMFLDPQIDEPEHAAETLTSLAELAIKEGDLKLAEKHLNQALNYSQQAYPKQRSREAGKVWLARADLSFQQQLYRQALEAYQAALKTVLGDQVADDIGQNPPTTAFYSENVIMDALEGKAAVWKALYNSENKIEYLYRALECHQDLLVIEDNIRRGFLLEEAKLSLTRESFQHRLEAMDISWQLFEQTKDEQVVEHAFVFAEKSHAALLTDALQNARQFSLTQVPEDLQRMERSIRKIIGQIEQTIFEIKRDEPLDTTQLHKLEAHLFSNRTRLDSLNRTLSSTYSAMQLMGDEPYSATSRDIIGQLPEGSLLLSYVWGKEWLYLAGVFRGEIFLDRMALGEKWEGKINQFIAELHSPEGFRKEGKSSAEYFAEQSWEIYQHFLAPALLKLDTTLVREIIVIPDGPLCGLPLDVLTSQAVQQASNFHQLPYLLDQFTFRYAFSAGALFMKTHENVAADQLFAGFAPAYGANEKDQMASLVNRGLSAEGFRPLVYNQQEVNELANLFNGGAYTGEDATEENFMEAANRSRILHLSMHGWLSTDHPDHSALAFYLDDQSDSGPGDGMLYVYELYGMHIPADLVVLSACQTLSGTWQRGEGIMSIARGFRQAGTQNLVGSLWNANDFSTHLLMKHYYQLLMTGVPKADALRQAKQIYLTETDRTHPFFWSAFVLVGDNEPLEAPFRIPALYWLGLAGLLISIIFWYKWKTGQVTPHPFRVTK